MKFTNSFGRHTQPLNIRSNLPNELHAPFCDALSRAAQAVTSESISAKNLASAWWDLLATPPATEGEAIDQFRKALHAAGEDKAGLSGAFDYRSQLIANQVHPHLCGESFLDWGCGDGMAAQLLSGQATLLDISDWRTAALDCQFVKYNEKEFPTELGERSFDTVLALTVLHHSKSPGTCLNHISRAANRRIVVIESVPELEHPAFNTGISPQLVDFARFEYCGFVDWLYNRVFHDDIQVTYNFLPTDSWEQMFNSAGFELTEAMPLGIDQPVAPEWHSLLIFDRR